MNIFNKFTLILSSLSCCSGKLARLPARKDIATIGQSGYYCQQMSAFSTDLNNRKVHYRGMNQLHVAIANGYVQEVKSLLSTVPQLASERIKSKYNPLAPSRINSMNALHFAVYKGNFVIVQLLIENHPELATQMVESPNDLFDDMNALHIAIIQGHKDVVQILMHRFPQLVTQVVQDYNNSYSGFNAFHLAVKCNRLAIVNMLIKEKPSLASQKIKHNRREYDGFNAFHLAVWHGCITDLLNTLITHYPQLVTATVDNKHSKYRGYHPFAYISFEGYNALQLAVVRYHKNIIEILIKKFPELLNHVVQNEKNLLHGHDALAIAYKMNREEIASLLAPHKKEEYRTIYLKNRFKDNLKNAIAFLNDMCSSKR